MVRTMVVQFVGLLCSRATSEGINTKLCRSGRHQDEEDNCFGFDVQTLSYSTIHPFSWGAATVVETAHQRLAIGDDHLGA